MAHGDIDLFGNNSINNQNDSIFGDFFGNNGFDIGDFGTSLDAFGSLFGAYNGLQQLDLGRDQFNFGRDLALTNLGNQANLTNSELTDRQNRRNRNAPNNGGNPLSTAQYLSQFGVSGVPGQDYQAPQSSPPINNTPLNPPAQLTMRDFGRG